jgi:hypothetical protein
MFKNYPGVPLLLPIPSYLAITALNPSPTDSCTGYHSRFKPNIQNLQRRRPFGPAQPILSAPFAGH